MARANLSGVPGTLLQLKITLLNIKPPIWRRVLVPDDLSFEQLHCVIQRAMNWGDCHLHEFEVGDRRIGGAAPDPFGFSDDDSILPEHSTQLREVLSDHKKFRYCYDFGDDWRHEIAVEKRLPIEPGAAGGPRLLAGKRACPPEDCGGPWGYAELLGVLGDPKHPEHAKMLEWAGEVDPEHFDLDAVAKAVAGAVRARKAKR